MSGHEHNHGHGHDHDHGHEHGHHHEPEPGPDASGWIRSAQTTTCPACDAPGALTLGGGAFCPTCGEITVSPGYQPAPAADTEPDPADS